MASPVMTEFCHACEALSYRKDPEAYSIMKSYIDHRDKYRRLYILKTIFRHSKAAELVDVLEKALASEDRLFVEHGLSVISDYKIKVPDDLLLSVIAKNLSSCHYQQLCALYMIDANEAHYAKLTDLFEQAKYCGQKEIIGEVLSDKYLPSKADDLFGLFSCDGFARIRLLAVRLAKEYGYNLSKFLSDMDGHVRNLAMKSLGVLSFLGVYLAKYHVDVSDDLESAIIYNPAGDDHLYIEYEEVGDYSSYTLSFSFQHVHMPDKESAKEWIDDILSEKRFSIEYFAGEERKFGGEINACELPGLSYATLEQNTGYFGETKLFHMVDNFKVRGWSKQNDFDGYFVEKNDHIHIERKS